MPRACCRRFVHERRYLRRPRRDVIARQLTIYRGVTPMTTGIGKDVDTTGMLLKAGAQHRGARAERLGGGVHQRERPARARRSEFRELAEIRVNGQRVALQVALQRLQRAFPARRDHFVVPLPAIAVFRRALGHFHQRDLRVLVRCGSQLTSSAIGPIGLPSGGSQNASATKNSRSGLYSMTVP